MQSVTSSFKEIYCPNFALYPPPPLPPLTCPPFLPSTLTPTLLSFGSNQNSPAIAHGQLRSKDQANNLPPNMEFLRLQRSIYFKASHLCRMYGRPGHSDVQTATCSTCKFPEINWNWHHEDFFVCSSCSDLAKQSSHRSAFLKLFSHRTNSLPSHFLLPYVFEYLYPEAMKHYHSRIQQTRTLKLSLLGFPGTNNSLFALHAQLLLQNLEQNQLNRHHVEDLLTNVCKYLI